MSAKNRVTQDLKYKQSLVEYSFKHGVTKAAIKYKTNRQYIYRWRRRYDGTLQSLANQSRRPHSHPNQHTTSELTLISNMRKRNMEAGLVVFWVKLLQRGYSRSISGLYRVLRRSGQMAVPPPNPKYIPKPYEQMNYPGQRVQIDVKYVPAACLVGEAKGKKFYQYTAIDEFSRLRFLQAFDELSTYSSVEFLKNAQIFFKHKGFEIECVQTDNGSEFTNRFTSKYDKPSLFEATADALGIRHILIRPYMARHNGKVERSHRKDNEYFYAVRSFYSLSDFSAQLKIHNRTYNNFPMRPLGWISPFQFLCNFLSNV